MLDKSVPYAPLSMRRDAGAPVPEAPLPPGFTYVYYAQGDEKDWSRIETSVLEFDNEMDGLLYFQRTFLPYGPELPLRCLFIQTDAGEKVATATAWWGYTGVRRDPMMHWVAVKPDFQGRGLGKAIIAQVLRRMIEIEGDRTGYLHTQTWSHKAVALYEWAGFCVTDEPNIQGHRNERCEEALALLNRIRNRVELCH